MTQQQTSSLATRASEAPSAQAAAPAPEKLRLDEADMLAAEAAFLWPNGQPTVRAGLALSGGGIRAATVALGVLEGLASRDLLRRIHFMSTVSGGGYIGSALSWFWSQRRVDVETTGARDGDPPIHRFGAAPTDFPFQSTAASPGPQQAAAAQNLSFLRQHGSYLTSGDGIGFAGLIMAVLRTVLLSLAVWLPLLVALFVGIEAVDDWLTAGTSQQPSCREAQGWAALGCRPFYKTVLTGAATIGVAFFAGVVLFALLSRVHISKVPAALSHRRVALIAASIAVAAGLTVHLVWMIRTLDPIQPLMGAYLAIVALVALGAVMVAIGQVRSPDNWGYYLRRSFEKFSSSILPIAVTATFIGALPVIVAGLQPAKEAPGWIVALGPVGALLTLLSGVATALYGYYLKAKSQLPGVAGQFLAVSGSLLFLAGLLLFSFVIAHLLVEPVTRASPSYGTVLIVAVLLLILAVVVGALGSINATGLHRFYRDRLMETFMPMTGAIAQGTAQQSDVADTLTVGDVVRSADERGDRPYHLINTHAILINEPGRPKLTLRGGDNFLISPAIIGSEATGWMRMADYLRMQGPLTLASAMAASGAAANANAGYIGTGVTRDRFLSTVMSILNIRLGLWVTNPGWLAKDGSRHGSWLGNSPTYFRPGFTSGILGRGHDSKAKFVELSDGGHFENLGLYELVRRRLDLIIVVDAEQDKDIHLSALVSSVNRIKEDFDVDFEFAPGKGPEILLGQEDKSAYPNGITVAKSPFMVAKINYHAGKRGPAKTGIVIYMKSTIVRGLEFATLGYRAINPDFPHQTTVDQFFDPDQFQAYRDLGRNSCTIMANALDITRVLAQSAAFSPDDLLKRYEAWDPDDAAATLTKKQGGP